MSLYHDTKHRLVANRLPDAGTATDGVITDWQRWKSLLVPGPAGWLGEGAAAFPMATATTGGDNKTRRRMSGPWERDCREASEPEESLDFDAAA